MDSRSHALRRHSLLILLILAIPAALPLVGRQAPPGTPRERTVRLSPAEATRLAKEARQTVSLEIAPGLDVSLWAPEQLVADPIALDLDDEGTLYVTGSSRAGLLLDIRMHPTWVPLVHTLKTVDDLRRFFERELAPERSGENTWLPDLNKDGSRDLRDLTELKERVYRIQDTNGDGVADLSQIMIEGFSEDPTYDVAGGLLYHEGDLFFGSAPGVWRLRDTNRDGAIDTRTVISEGYSVHPAFAGHGISGVTLGPDGRIYWEVGDIGLSVVDKTGRRWSYPNQGAVLRAEPDGSNFEVFATGIRNLQEFAFDEHGNLISVDNDGDHQGETERLVYIPEGSDSGWRSNWQYGKYTDPNNNRYNVWMAEAMFKPRFPGQAAHILPPIAPYHAGPSGMLYNPGTALSEEWRNHFLMSSFPGAPGNARIHAFRLKEAGAGFALESDKVLLQGILTVGMTFGPEGALYLADWITGWGSSGSGRIWKVDAPAAAGSKARTDVRALLSSSFGTRPLSELTTLLGHADMRIRQRAQFELVRRRDVKTLSAAARESGERLARIHAIWGIGQLARKNPEPAKLLTPLLTDTDPEIRAQAAKMLGDARHVPAAEAMLPLLKDTAARPRFFAAEALGRMAYKPAVAPLVDMLVQNDDGDVFLRHAGIVALSRIGDTSALAALSTHASPGVRLAGIVALRRLRHADVARFLSDTDETVVTEAARAINDDGSIEAALPALARVLDEKRFTAEPLLRRSINANLRVGTKDAVARVAVVATDPSRPDDIRVEAVSALGVWSAPSPLDRVDGFYLGPMEQRDAAAARAEIARLYESGPVAEQSTAMRVALADAAGKLGATSASPILLQQLRGDTSPQVRVAALRALQTMKVPDIDEVMRIAFADGDFTVRRAALGFLPSLAISDAAKVSHLSTVMKGTSVVDQQSALEVLGTLKSAEAEQYLASLADDLAAGRIAPDIQVDVLEAIQTRGSAPLLTTLESYRTAKGAPSVLAAFREALTHGGDARRGSRVFEDNPAGACTRCHSIRPGGANVGPNLAGIGATLTRDQILEALLEPNARIAPGFGTIVVALKNGKQVDGILRDETPTHLVVATGTPAVEQRIGKAEIAERTDPISGMPAMGEVLKPREIRDVVAFLSSLKQGGSR